MNGETYQAIAKEIEEAIIGITPQSVSDAKNSTWTRSVKEIVGNIGKNKGFCVCASGFNPIFEPEWLYDLIWYKNNSDIRLETVPLVLESEWLLDYYDIRFDFEKLLLANAPIKVMVFQDGGNHTMEELFARLVEGIHQYIHGGFGIYILACYQQSEGRFEVREITKRLTAGLI